jgi:hypothetical protein
MGDGAADSIVPVAAVTTNIPEFHDCQRLLSERIPELYGPLAGVWVSYRLDSLLDSLPRRNLGSIKPATSGGTIAGVQPPGVRPWTIIPGKPRTALMVAQIYLWDGDYPVLGLKRGWNCLYFLPDTTLSGLSALMVSTLVASACPDFASLNSIRPTEKFTGVTPLYVATTGPTGLRRGAFPPVGRWDWDAKLRHQYIGVGCKRAWCEVTGDKAYASSRAYPLTSGTEPERRRRVFEVKGWYDEQRLALHNTNMGDSPAAFHGVAIPDTTLDAIDDTSGFEGKWISAAWATVGLPREVVDPKYETTFNFRPGDLADPTRPKRLSHVFMCQGRVEQCFPKDSGATPPANCKDHPGWWARIDSPDIPGRTNAATTYACVGRVDHREVHAPHIPGTARWFWLKNDEKLWMRCAEGCCTLN